MNIYFDKANLASYILSRDDEGYDDCMQMLKKDFDFKFNFSKADILRSQEDKDSERDINEAIINWIKSQLVQGCKGAIDFNEDNGDSFPQRPLPQKFHEGMRKEELSSIYLINDEKTCHIKRNGLMLLASKGEELSTLRQLMVADNDLTTVINPKDLQKWGDLDQYTTPCSDIIILDPYIIVDSKLLQDNIYELTRVLSSKAHQAAPNIVIITSKRNTITHNPQLDIGNNLRQYLTTISATIKSNVKKATKAAPNVTIVLLPQDMHEHDRIIFTNYRLINSGDSFNYFNNEKNITYGRMILVASLGKKDIFQNSMELIDDLQQKISRTLKLDSALIFGDKICNYFNFK